MKTALIGLVLVLGVSIISPTALTKSRYSGSEDTRTASRFGNEFDLPRQSNAISAKGSSEKVASVQAGEPSISAEFISASIWASGFSWGAETFQGSIGKGIAFFGSNVTNADYVPPTEIRIAPL